MRPAVNPIVVRALWGIGLVAVWPVNLPIVLYIAVLVIALVAAFRRAGPINFLPIATGFLSWLVINTLLWIWILPEQGSRRYGLSDYPIIIWLGFIVVCVNIVALLVLSSRGRWITMGVFLWILVNAVGTLLFMALDLMEHEGYFGALRPPFFLALFYLRL